MFVKHRFVLDAMTVDYIHSLVPRFGYNGFGEVIFYRTYSRTKADGSQESWNDVVCRVTAGTYSIRKDFYLKNYIPWDEAFWQGHAYGFAKAMFEMKWIPPGRGLWAMGSDFVYERGAMALYNCAFTELGEGENFADDVCWIMDTLMHGVGVGFTPLRDKLSLRPVSNEMAHTCIIHDSREGWVDAVRRVLLSYIQGSRPVQFAFHLIRKAGSLIRGFGGVSSGPEPLEKLLVQIAEQCELFLKGMDVVEFKTNISNLVGCCVVAGNVRRSAEISCGSIHDQVFMNLKDYRLNPHREAFGWMSNNSVLLDHTEDFDKLGEIAERVIHNGEPGVINRKNIKFGRIGKALDRVDYAVGFNPCGEIPLEHREVCNLSETLPTMCDGADDWYKACEYATFYSSTVSLLPTHQPSTNRVVARNRRIGVGIIDFSGWKHVSGVHQVTKWLRNGYDVCVEANRQLNAEAGVPEAIRKTTIKPGGTTPKLAGRTSGCGHPTFHYTLRRVRVAQNAPIHPLLVEAGVPYEKDYYSANTDCFEFPILQGPAKPATDVSLWEQAMSVVLLQREWSDNAVSNTLYFRPMWRLVEIAESGRELLDRTIGSTNVDVLLGREQKVYIVTGHMKATYRLNAGKVVDTKIYEYDPAHEESDIEPVLSSIIPLVKSVSLLPHTDLGAYKQMAEEGITQDEYHRRLSAIRPIDWSKFEGSDGMDERYCTSDMCEIPNKGNAKCLTLNSVGLQE
jgi:ribonucleoside-triphosphate reductase